MGLQLWWVTKELTVLVKKEMPGSGPIVDDLVLCIYNIVQLNLCAKSLQLNNVKPVVIKCISLIKSRGPNCHLYKKSLKDLNAVYHNFISGYQICLMSGRDMLRRFSLLRNEIS